jgi:hypothetical protein
MCVLTAGVHRLLSAPMLAVVPRAGVRPVT